MDLSNYKLVFSDEFSNLSLSNGASGTWKTTDYWGGRTLSGNGEQEYYVDPAYKNLGLNPFSVADGVLTIKAEKASAAIKPQINNLPYTSGMITSEQSFSMQYGYFEMRAQLPAGKGLWPAFWMLPIDGSWPPELDIMEVLGSSPTTLVTTAHTNQNGTHQMFPKNNAVANTSTGYHTYGVDWQKDKIAWYFDGQKVYEIATPADMHQPMYMIANLAVGGYWPGSPDANTVFPANMKIDYIRAYQKPSDHAAVSIPTSWAAINPATAFSNMDGTGAVATRYYNHVMRAGDVKAQMAGETRYIVGSDINNYIAGSNGQYNNIDGGKGNDVLKGNGGIDVFVLRDGGGNDVILDLSQQDKVQLDGFHFTHFNDVRAWMTQVGSDVMLRLDQDQALLFKNITIAQIQPENFVFTNTKAAPAGTPTTPSTPAPTPTPSEPTGNKVATITGDVARTVTEDSASVLKASGKLTVSDADAGQAYAKAATLTSGLGTFTVAADGSWTYSADNAQSEVQSLNAGQKLTDTFKVTSADGSATKDVVITIMGTNETQSQPTNPPTGNPTPVSQDGPAYSATAQKSFYGSTAGGTLAGTSGHDALWGQSDAALTLVGGAGDDTYYVKIPTNNVVEQANSGTDTVVTWMNYTLPDNVENLQALAGGTSGTGNALNNILTGAGGVQTFDGMGGNDWLQGGNGSDVFKFHTGSGNDRVLDFQDGATGDQDMIMISKSLFADFNAVRSAMSLVDADKDGAVDDVLIAGPHESMALLNISLAGLGADDFRFY